MELQRAITLPGRAMKRSDVKPKALLSLGSFTRSANSPGVEPRGRNFQHPAHESHGELTTVAFDASVLHRDSFAKNAVAFFRKSLSCRSTSTSRLSRLTSASSSGPVNSPGGSWLRS